MSSTENIIPNCRESYSMIDTFESRDIPSDASFGAARITILCENRGRYKYPRRVGNTTSPTIKTKVSSVRYRLRAPTQYSGQYSSQIGSTCCLGILQVYERAGIRLHSLTREFFLQPPTQTGWGSHIGHDIQEQALLRIS